MIPLETKQSGGKLLSHSDMRGGGSVSRRSIMQHTKRPRRRWVDNIRMDLQEVGCGYVDWNGLAQDRDRWGTFVSAVMNLRVP